MTMPTDFSSLTAATDRQGTDEVAVARGTGTNRMPLSILAPLERVAALPTANDSALRTIYVLPDGRQHWLEKRHVPSAAATPEPDWTDLTAALASTNGFDNFKGVFSNVIDFLSTTGVVAGDHAFILSGRQFYEATTVAHGLRAVAVQPSAVLPATGWTWLGADFRSEADASRVVVVGRNLAFWSSSNILEQGERHLVFSNAITTAPVTGHDEYHWHQLATVEDFQAVSDQLTTSDRTNIGSFTGSLTDRDPQEISLNEAIADGNDYQIEFVDAGGFGAISPMFSGETYRAKMAHSSNPLSADPANHRRTIASWLGLRFNNEAFTQDAVERWSIQKGNAANTTIFFTGNSASQAGAMTATVYKYPRGRGAKGDAGGSAPTYIWWAKGATARYGNEFPNGINPTSNRARLEFKDDNPNEKYHTTADPASWWVASVGGANIPNLDATGNPSAATARVVFQPPAGTWKILLQFKMDAVSSTVGNGIGMFEIATGTDDEVVIEPVGSSVVSGFGAAAQLTGRIESDELVTTGTRQFYFMGNWPGTADLNYYLRAEKVI